MLILDARAPAMAALPLLNRRVVMVRYRFLGVVSFVAFFCAFSAFADKHKDSKSSDQSSSHSQKSSGTQHVQAQSSSQHGSSNNEHHGSTRESRPAWNSSGSGTSSTSNGSNDRHGTSGNEHHGSAAQSRPAWNSGSGTSSTSTEHSNSGSHHGQWATGSPSSGDVKHEQPHTVQQSSGKYQGHSHENSPNWSSTKAHDSHDSLHNGVASHDNNHDRSNAHHGYVNVDHARLHDRMQVHPGASDRQHAFEHSRVERERFTRHAGAIRFVPAHRVVLSNIRIVPTTYHYRRTVFYDTYEWQPPVYVYGFSPRYGLWDATFLAFALDHVAEEQYALMFYHHQNEQELQQWMSDAESLATENEQLRSNLDRMKEQMATLKEAGITSDPSYVPPDAQDVALSPEVITQLTQGQQSGNQ
jgi:hypothetical protein